MEALRKERREEVEGDFSDMRKRSPVNEPKNIEPSNRKQAERLPLQIVNNLVGSQMNGTQFVNKSYSRATDGRNVRLWAKYQF